MAKKNKSPEQNLINDYVALKNKDDGIKHLYNDKCRGENKFADLEFISKDGIHWVIEAKSHETTSNHNAAHILFGELLKETGKARETKKNITIKYALLLSDIHFFRNKFRLIPKAKFIEFGKLIPINDVFVVKNKTDIIQLNWEDFYENTKEDE